jgi:hypothetical protein
MVPRGALVLGKLRAAPVRSGWAGAPQRGRGNGEKVVRKRGRGMKICRVKYYVDFRSILDSKRAYAPLPWNQLEHEDIYILNEIWVFKIYILY